MHAAPTNNYELFSRLPKEVGRAFFIEMFINGGYDEILYLYEKSCPETEKYISKKSQKHLSAIGMEFFSSKSKVEKLLLKEKHLAQKLKDLLLSQQTKARDDSETWHNLSTFYTYFTEYWRLYRFTEAFYTPFVDEIVHKFIYENNIGKDSINEALHLLLNPPSGKTTERKREKLLAGLPPDKGTSYLCEAVRTVGAEKIQMRENINVGWGFLEQLLDEIAVNSYISSAQIQSLFFREVKEIVNEKDAYKLECIIDQANTRNEALVAKKIKNKYQYFTGSQAKKIAAQVREPLDVDAKKILGDVTCVGHAKGRVIVIPQGIGKKGAAALQAKIAQMRQGDIVVTSTAGPETIMACRKAGAIIAEEGGINSHAAIITREFKIPGIVNTKIATKLLRDGDYVEVNAEKGIVRILNNDR